MSKSIDPVQIQSLMNFIHKHKIQEIPLNKAESQVLFEEVDKAKGLESSRLFLQAAFAEGIISRTEEYTKKLIIPRESIIGATNFYDEYTPEVEDSSDHYNPYMKELLGIYTRKIDMWSLIDKLAEEVNIRFPISKGQARAVLYKLLNYKLDSGTRSFLHDLRIKIRKYRELVEHFEEYVILPSEEPTLHEEMIRDANQKLKAPPVEPKRPSSSEKAIQEFFEKRKEIMKGLDSDEALTKIEVRMATVEPIYFKCGKCQHQEEIPIEFLESSNTEELPKHCDAQMSIYIPSKTIKDRVR